MNVQSSTTDRHGDRRGGSRLVELVVDSLDPAKLARFWADVLDYELAEDDSEYTCIEPRDGSGPAVTFVKVDEQKTSKNRLHFDLNPERDQDDEVARLLALGARKLDVGQGDASWIVMADPEGNEFCVL